MDRKFLRALVSAGVIGAIVVAVVLALHGAAWAEEPPAPEEGAGTVGKVSLLTIIGWGGLIGHTIILMSFVGTAFVIEGFVTLRRSKMVPPEILTELEALFDENNYEEAIAVCEQHDCYLTRIVGAGLSKISLGHERMNLAIQEANEVETNAYFQKIGYLALISNIAPMMGLLGTVFGMVMAFSVIAGSSTAPSPKELAKGIMMALITTVEGLCVAIPILTVFYILKNRISKVILEVSAITSELLDAFRAAEQ